MDARSDPMDTHIESGLAQHLEGFGARLRAGAQRLGWKVAFNPPAIQQLLGLPYSLVAGLTGATVIDAAEAHSLAGMTRPLLEAEVAVWLGSDVAPDAEPAQVALAIARWAPAIELVDFDRDPRALEAVLAAGVFHRGVLLGTPLPAPPGAALHGRRVCVRHGQATLCEVDAGEATGDAAEVVLHLARLLSRFGWELAAGDVVILGSMNPPCEAQAGETFHVAIDGLGEASLSARA